jgi:sodium-dependent dicarboxylate transporter 2/3/5
MHPVYLLLPLTLAVSLAFCLPVATPNNAIIFTSGHLRMTEMVVLFSDFICFNKFFIFKISTGFLMNIFGFLIIFIASNTWLGIIFDLKMIQKTVFNSTLI